MNGTRAKAIKGKTLIDGNGGPVMEDPIILLEGKRVKSVGSANQITVPRDAEVVDASHCTLMPGMMDLHIHLCMFNNRTFKNYRVAQWEITPELQQLYALFHAQLCFEMGFTTLRDLGLTSTRGLLTEHMCAVRDSINAGILAVPRRGLEGEDRTIRCLDDANARPSYRSCNRNSTSDRNPAIHPNQDEEHSTSLLRHISEVPQVGREHCHGHRHGIRTWHGQ